jgi:hypothetical protein
VELGFETHGFFVDLFGSHAIEGFVFKLDPPRPTD